MSLERLYDKALRYAWLVVILVIIGGAIPAYKIKTKYSSDCTLYVLNIDQITKSGRMIDSSDITLGRQLAQDFIEICRSRRVSEETARRLSSTGISARTLNNVVAVSNQKDSSFITVSATWTDPETAAQISNTMSNVMAETINEITKSNNVSVLDTALSVQTSDRIRFIAAGIIVGILLSFTIIYLLALFDKTIKSSEDVENELQIDVIGILPKHSIK